MKIIFATEDYYPLITGGARFERALALSLVKRGHKVYIFCPAQNFEDRQDQDGGTLIYRQKALPLPFYHKFTFSVLPGARIKKQIEKIKPEVVHTHNPHFNGLATLKAAKKFKIPILSTNHTMPENIFPFIYPLVPLRKPLYELIWKYIIWFNNQANFVTTPTQTGLNYLKAHGLKVEAKPVSNGINLEKFQPMEKEPLKKHFNLPNLPLILYTGRLDPEKRVDFISRAMPQVLTKLNCRLVITGEGKDRQKIQNLVKKLNLDEKVIFLGFLPEEDLQKIYNACDLYVIASTAELQSITTLEAIASGLPVVASNLGALPELVRDGENGFLFNAQAELPEKILDIFSDASLKDKMSARSLEIVKAHDFSNTVKEYEAI